MKKDIQQAMEAMKEARATTVASRVSTAKNAYDRQAENAAYNWHKNRRDPGMEGKQIDVITRYLQTGKIEYCHRAGETDIKGKGFAVEVKHGQTGLTGYVYSSKEEALEAIESFTCLKSQFIAYAWKVDPSIADINDKMRIVSSHAFIKFMKSIGKLRVQEGSAKSGNKGKWAIYTQHFYNSIKAEKLLNEFMESGWTLAEHAAEYEYYTV